MEGGYKKLKVWQRSVDLVIDIYKVTENFPKSEVYGLVMQIKRAVVSIPTNIAEGSAKYSGADFARFINIARGSVAELETELVISKELNYITEFELKKFEKELDEINRMLFSLRNSVKPGFNEDAEIFEFQPLNENNSETP